MYTPISKEEMYRLMEESCRGNKTGKTDFGFVPFTPSEVEEFLKEQGINYDKQSGETEK